MDPPASEQDNFPLDKGSSPSLSLLDLPASEQDNFPLDEGRRLNTYLRCTQTEQRLSALALIHMNYEIEISVDDVCKTFLQKHPRKMEKANLLFD